MMNRKIISEACTENSPLKVFGSTNAVAGVVLGERGGAGGPAEPVVEAADPDQVAERRGDQGADGDDRVPVPDRVPAVQRADHHDDRRAQGEAERHAEEGAVPAGCDEPLSERHPCASRRYFTRASSSSFESLSLKSWGMMFGLYPLVISAFGFSIEVRMKLALTLPSLPRSGPTFAVAPALARVWQPEQPFEVKS